MKCNLQFELLTIYHSKLACKMSYTPNYMTNYMVIICL